MRTFLIAMACVVAFYATVYVVEHNRALDPEMSGEIR